MVDCTRFDVANFFFCFGAIAVAAYAVFVYGFLTQTVVPLGATVHPLMKAAFETEKVPIYLHALSSAVALAIGPFQVIPGWRKNHMLAHRRAGYVFFVASMIGSITGIICAKKAQGGTVGVSGFTTLGSLWLTSNIVGFFSIVIFKSLYVHQRAMEISCCLAYAAVTLRMLLPIAVSDPTNYGWFSQSYGKIAWTCWTGNLFVYFLIRFFWIPFSPSPSTADENDNENDNDASILGSEEHHQQEGDSLLNANEKEEEKSSTPIVANDVDEN